MDSSSTVSSESLKSIYIKGSNDGSRRSSKYDFDIFIHYDPEDHEFVFKHIISHLEGDFNCTFAAKDFSPGRMQDDCILHALRKSYWTFIVYSKKSVKSGYSTFLYHQSICKSGGRRLLAIRIDECKIPKDLENVSTILDFTLMPEAEFHRRLLSVLSDKPHIVTAPNRKPPLPSPRVNIDSRPATECTTSETCTATSTDYMNLNDVPKQHERSLDRVLFHSRRVGPAIVRSRINNQIVGELFPGQGARNELDEKWSVTAYHGNLDEFLVNFHRANPTGKDYHEFEHTLLNELQPEMDDHSDKETVNLPTLARLTCCPSRGINNVAFTLLENRIMRDNYHSPTSAHGLMVTEELLRTSILDKPFNTETSDLQATRLQVYSRLLFCVSMHAEKKHLIIDDDMAQKVLEVTHMAAKRLKLVRHLPNSMKYALIVVCEASKYLNNLVSNMEWGFSLDNISQRIEALETGSNFMKFEPSFSLQNSLHKEHHWIYLEVILNYVTNVVFQDRQYVYILLRHIPLLLKSFDVRSVVSGGVLLSVARMLVRIITQHDMLDVRMSAMFGINNSTEASGLTALWQASQFKQCSDLRKDLDDIIMPLILTAVELKIRQVIHAVFVQSAYCNPKFQEENIVLDLIRKYLVSTYECIGDRIEFTSNTTPCSNYNIMKGRLNHVTVVVVKVPRIYDCGHLVQTNEPSPAAKLLRNEIDVLARLSHNNVVELLRLPGPGMQLMHGVFQYAGGSLQRHLWQVMESAGRLGTTRLQLLDWCLQVGNALAYLGERGVVHREICAQNVLLQQIGATATAKLSGFSMACRVGCNAREEKATRTTADDKVLLRWSDPLSLHKGFWSLQTDLWMFWCFVYEVFTLGAHPFAECLDAVDVPNMVLRGYSLQQPLCVPNDLNLLIQKGLQPDVTRRTTITKILKDLHYLSKDWHCANKDRDVNNTLDTSEIQYPCCPHDGMYRMSPEEFQGKQLKPASTQGGDTEADTPDDSAQLKILVEQDMVDITEIDQPKDNIIFMGWPRKPVHVNIEIFKAQPERISVLESLRHIDVANICRILQLDQSPNQKEAKLVTELDIGDNILDAILHNPTSYTKEHVVSYFVQVLEGLQILHTRYHVVHTDLRAQYIYVGKVLPCQPKGYFQVKIGRLSRCKMLYKCSLDAEGRTKDLQCIPIDSLRWAPPEVILAPAYYSRSSDIYSVALLFWQLMYALQANDKCCIDPRLLVPHPEWRLHREEFLRNRMLCKHPEQPVHCPDWAYVLIKMCLRVSYKRPTIDLLQEALTSREPFKSTLLKGVLEKLMSTTQPQQLKNDEEQAENAPYLEQYQFPPSETMEPTCLDPQFDEHDDYFLVNARFGFRPSVDHEALLLQRYISDATSGATSGGASGSTSGGTSGGISGVGAVYQNVWSTPDEDLLDYKSSYEMHSFQPSADDEASILQRYTSDTTSGTTSGGASGSTSGVGALYQNAWSTPDEDLLDFKSSNLMSRFPDNLEFDDELYDTIDSL